MLSVIVLAAGLSKRMGEKNKLLLPYNNKTIIENTIERIIDAKIGQVIVVTGYESSSVGKTIKHLPINIIYNPDYEKGMTTSIQKGVEIVKGNGFMICLADMYAITTQEYRLIADAFTKQYTIDNNCICIPCYENERGNPVTFSAIYRNAILQHTDMEGCKAIAQANKQHVHLIQMNTSNVLQDIDYPDDYEKLSND